MFHLPKGKYLHKLFIILLHGRFVYSPLFIYLFIQSVICLYQKGLVDIYFILWVTIQYYFIFFLLKFFQLWLLVALLVSSCIPLIYPIILGFVLCFEHFLTFWSYKMLQAHLVSFLPHSKNRHFSKEPWLLWLENGVRNKDLGTRCTIGMSLLPISLSHPSRWSQSTELISLCYASASH